jgi:hypothetical protein
VAVAVAIGRLHELLDLGLREVLAGAQVAIAASPRGNCSFYGSWRDQPEVSFRHVFGPPGLTYWSYDALFTNSVKPTNDGNHRIGLGKKANNRQTGGGPIPTLGDLQRTTPWVWLWCERCQHHAPLACAVAVIRWGPDVSSDRLRQLARCSCCGKKGATIQHPGWGGNDVGFLPFPT